MDDRWWTETESPKAWMSVRDADLYETLLHRLAERKAGTPLAVVEWGTGRSTLWYTRFLEALRAPYRWLAIEHDHLYFESAIAPELSQRSNATIVRGNNLPADAASQVLDAHGVFAVVFDAGPLFPFRAGHEPDRNVDLDDYVALPAHLGFECDLAVIDGRKRRRCALEAGRLIRDGGYVILHDAWRQHYQCAFSSFSSGRRFGDEWWIGSNAPTNFGDVLPWHAFERSRESAINWEVPPL